LFFNKRQLPTNKLIKIVSLTALIFIGCSEKQSDQADVDFTELEMHVATFIQVIC
jgi:hypothetical protein